MPRALISKDDVLAILVETFRRDGYDGASIATLSKATALGKSSLYHHFPGGKVDMATEVLDFVHAWVAHRVVATLEGGGTPRTANVARERMKQLAVDLLAPAPASARRRT